MAGEWRETRLGELGEFRNGVNFNRHQEGLGIPVVKVKDFEARMYVPDSGFDELHSASIEIPESQLLKKNDIIVIRSNGNSALVGRSMLFRGSPRPTTFSGFCIRFRPIADKVDPVYIAYFLRSPFCRQRFSAYGSGTGIQNLSQDLLADVPVQLPTLRRQRAIAHILGTLDDKIELNRRMNETLEAMARAIFKSWFVDFDPVRAKMDGRKPKGMDAATAKLFPDGFEESELGSIPRGWKVGRIRDLCLKIENGGTPDRQVADYWHPPEVPWLTSGEVRQGFIVRTESFVSRQGFENSSAKMWPSLTTVVALYGATAGYATLLGMELCANQACCGLVPKPETTSYNYLAVSASLDHFQQQTRGSAQQNLSQSIVADLPVVMPPKEALSAFDCRALPILSRCCHNLRESMTVAAIRDTLLPRLLSGDLGVEQTHTKNAGAC
jgi:type I restriction enzyme S subunit